MVSPSSFIAPWPLLPVGIPGVPADTRVYAIEGLQPPYDRSEALPKAARLAQATHAEAKAEEATVKVEPADEVQAPDAARAKTMATEERPIEVETEYQNEASPRRSPVIFEDA